MRIEGTGQSDRQAFNSKEGHFLVSDVGSRGGVMLVKFVVDVDVTSVMMQDLQHISARISYIDDIIKGRVARGRTELMLKLHAGPSQQQAIKIGLAFRKRVNEYFASQSIAQHIAPPIRVKQGSSDHGDIRPKPGSVPTFFGQK